jgi:hypothetical protein
MCARGPASAPALTGPVTYSTRFATPHLAEVTCETTCAMWINIRTRAGADNQVKSGIEAGK